MTYYKLADEKANAVAGLPAIITQAQADHFQRDYDFYLESEDANVRDSARVSEWARLQRALEDGVIVKAKGKPPEPEIVPDEPPSEDIILDVENDEGD